MLDVFDAFFNNFINTLIRHLPWATRSLIGFILFTVSLLCFNKSFRPKNDLHPIKAGWAVLFVLTLTLSILYVTI